jgi:hypothetical protein
MTRQWLSCCLVLLCVAPAFATSTRSLSDQIDATDIEVVMLETGVGDIEIIAVDHEVITYQVVLEPRRGGLFSSKRRAEREVQEADLDATVNGASLYLHIRSDSSERRFEETWTIELPARLSVEMDHGVGKITINQLAGSIDIESGVGDIDVHGASGDVTIGLGVGDAEISGCTGTYESAECAAGVGDAYLRINGRKIGEGGFLANTASWSGDGEHEIKVDVGVGDAKVVLDDQP